MPCPNHDHSRAALATNHALPTNQHDRVYQHRQAWPSEEKVALAIGYLKAQDAANGARPNISLLSKTGTVARSTITKIERELKPQGQRRAPTEIRQSSDSPSGPGALVLDDLAIFVLLMRYQEEPRRTWEGCTIGLSGDTGTLVSTSTISRFFHYGVEIKVSLCKPKLIPYDKFRPEN